MPALQQVSLISYWGTFALEALSSIFFLVNPFATVPAFLAITAGQDLRVRRRIARRAAWTCFFILSVFTFCGSLVFQMFGISLASCQIAGGLIMLLIGLEMLQGRRSATQEHSSETQEAATKEDIGITPLGVPMLAGPGAISAVIVLTEDPPRWVHMSIIFLVIVVTSLSSYLILAGADRIGRRLDEPIRLLTQDRRRQPALS